MAVYTPLSQNEIEDFLSQYDIGGLDSFEAIAEGIQNTNYLLLTRRSKCILTLYEERIEAKDLPFYLGLTEWLADRGIKCPRPIHGKDGRMVYPLKGKPAALVEFLEGSNNPAITTRHMELTGGLIARMHLAAEGFLQTRRNVLSLDGWRSLFSRFRGEADGLYAGLEKTIAQELDYLENHWPHGLPSGVIHADLFPENIFFTSGKEGLSISGVIDFYFACNDFWVYDLAICMNAWCFDGQWRFAPERAGALFKAYQHVRPLSGAERSALPALARGAALRFLLTRAYDWIYRVPGALVTPKNPMEYLAKLQFHQHDGHYGEYGV